MTTHEEALRDIVREWDAITFRQNNPELQRAVEAGRALLAPAAQPVDPGRGHRSRQDDGTYIECPGPASYIVNVGPTGGGTMDYHCRGCGKNWSVS